LFHAACAPPERLEHLLLKVTDSTHSKALRSFLSHLKRLRLLSLMPMGGFLWRPMLGQVSRFFLVVGCVFLRNQARRLPHFRLR
jgi:hypothetical protein